MDVWMRDPQEIPGVLARLENVIKTEKSNDKLLFAVQESNTAISAQEQHNWSSGVRADLAFPPLSFIPTYPEEGVLCTSSTALWPSLQT